MLDSGAGRDNGWVVSHSRLESDRARSLAAGADDSLHKDFDVRRLVETLRGVLDRWLER